MSIVSNNITIPVVLFLYKRPESTSSIIHVLKIVKPKELFIFVDGPKNNDEKATCKKTIDLLNEIDWNPIIHLKIQEQNIGCVNSIINGLNTVFSRVEKAIILEDDCIPTPFFFTYCQSLLNHYESNDSVMHINGINLLDHLSQDIKSPESYYFSKFSLPSWGWATWGRSWKKFNQNLDTWQKNKSILFINIQQKYFNDWTTIFEDIRLHKQAWDIPWNIDIWKNKGLVIIPKHNLITYQGFDNAATLTKNIKNKFSSIQANNNENKIVHPEAIQLWNYDPALEAEIITLLKSL